MPKAIKINMRDLGPRKGNYSVENGSTKADTKDTHESDPLYTRASIYEISKEWCSKTFTVNLLKRRLPIITWLPVYSLEDFKGDLIAGITVALTVIPQGLAYAGLAGLPPQFGLYTAFIGCFMYTIFGSCKNLTIGPTAIMSLMTKEHASAGGIPTVILITFLTGCIQLVMGVLNLGFLMSFISSSVISGFTSAAAITIATTQISGIFGIVAKSDGFSDDVKNFFNGLINHNFQNADMIMGLSSIAFLFMLKYCIKLKSVCCGIPDKIAEIFLKTVGTARNALLVLVCSTVAGVMITYGFSPFLLSQEVDSGLPPFKLPEFSYDFYDNVTNTTEHRDFADNIKIMGSGLVILPMICLLEAIAIAKSFSKGKRIDSTQEMIAIGICNIMGSFVSAYPATGSFSRTAINYSSGVRTTAGGIFTGVLVILALDFMSPYFHFIPKATLSALIFISVLNMVHYEDVVAMWKTNKWDLLPFSATFLISFVLGLEYGIMCGIAISMVLILLQEFKPNIKIEERQTYLGCPYLYVNPDRTVLFPSAEKLQTKILKSVPEQIENTVYCVLVDAEHITTVDYTMVMNMKSLSRSLKDENVTVLFVNLKANVLQSLKGCGSGEFLFFTKKEDAENHIDAITVVTDYPPAYSHRQSLRSDDVSFAGS